MPRGNLGPDMLHHFTGESRHELAHSGNVVKGSHENGLQRRWANALVAQRNESILMRRSNESVHTGAEGLALVRRENTNSTLQPLYPMSVVNDSFNRHLQAKAIESRCGFCENFTRREGISFGRPRI